VDIQGDLTVNGGKNFKIDHPLDPANKYLFHSAVESSERKNIYDGIAILDGRGKAAVSLPRWFTALNERFRYQLTALGAAAPDLHIGEEISNNRFTIAGGKPRMKVSWQVTGVRRDAWAKKNPMVVEKSKPSAEKGRYLHPEPYVKGTRAAIEAALHPEMIRQVERLRHAEEMAVKRAKKQSQTSKRNGEMARRLREREGGVRMRKKRRDSEK
jgi:hypothetical protein